MNEMSDVFIIGAGGHCISVLSLITKERLNVCGIYDESYKPNSPEYICNIKLIGNLNEIRKKNTLILAIGDNDTRSSLLTKYKHQIIAKNLYHPRSYIDRNVIIGLYNQFFGDVFVNGEARIGDNNILNTGCIIEHESIIGSNNHISVGVIICGRVIIGNNCFIGAGTVVIDKVSICDNVITGANSTVISSITEPGVYVGNPAKRIK
jgi:UDP-N-acetylbacillosamine N-acetyltransferase